MPSLLKTLKLHPSSSPSGNSNGKKDAAQQHLTPLERLLQDAGPIRDDGSDKFFGLENFGNTCYCNSIIQCLYFSVPFREQVLNYPRRSPLESLLNDQDGKSKLTTTVPARDSTQTPISPTKGKPAQAPVPRPITSTGGLSKPEDKESPEYKKKQLMAGGPVWSMNYDNASSYGMTESIFTSLKDLFEAIIANQARNGIISPTRFLEIWRKENEVYRSSMHQDAHEFFNMLLNQIVDVVEGNPAKEDEVAGNGTVQGGLNDQAIDIPSMPALENVGTKTPTKSKWVHELFEGTLTSETKCLTCENVSQRDEPFLDLSVDLEAHSSVTSCLRKFSEEEMLCERDKFFCDKCCGLQEAEKRMKIKRLPRILALHLKRFKYTEDLQRLQKLFHRVVYPYHLRLFNTTSDAEDPDRLYELYAIVVHIGSGPYHGHYAAIIKTEDRGWLLFDDEMVEPVDKSFVRNFFGDRPGQACAYVLFYQETTLEAVKKEQEAENLTTTATSGVDVPPSKEREKESHRLSPTVSNPPAAVADLVTNPREEGPSNLPSLDHAISAPPTISSPLSPTRLSAWNSPLLRHTASKTAVSAQSNAVSAQSTPPPPTLQPPTNKVSDQQSKRERAKEEKERKAAEKEFEKQEKAKRKSNEAGRKRADSSKQKSDSAAAAAAAHSNSLATLEALRRATGASHFPHQDPTSSLMATPFALNSLSSTSAKNPKSSSSSNEKKTEPPVSKYSAAAPLTNGKSSANRNDSGTVAAARALSPHPPPPPPKDPPKLSDVNAAALSTSPSSGGGPLNRFRQTSRSLKNKPKFWGSGNGQNNTSISNGNTNQTSKDSSSALAAANAAVNNANQDDSTGRSIINAIKKDLATKSDSDGAGLTSTSAIVEEGEEEGDATTTIGVNGVPGIITGPETNGTGKVKRSHRFSLRKKASSMLT